MPAGQVTGQEGRLSAPKQANKNEGRVETLEMDAAHGGIRSKVVTVRWAGSQEDRPVSCLLMMH